MTKETLILYWLSIHRPEWVVRYLGSLIIYTISGGLVIEYDYNANNDEECTVYQDGVVIVWGTVEYCLKNIKKPG